MPDFAFIEHDFQCPACHAALDDVGSLHPAAFQWGYCHGQSPNRSIYRVGDRLHWRSLPDGRIPAWTFFQDGGGNVGDPAIRRLTVTDLSSMRSLGGTKCPHCGLRFGGAAVEIEDSRITAAFILGADSPFTTADHHIYEADGNWTPVEDWTDHAMWPASAS